MFATHGAGLRHPARHPGGHGRRRRFGQAARGTFCLGKGERRTQPKAEYDHRFVIAAPAPVSQASEALDSYFTHPSPAHAKHAATAAQQSSHSLRAISAQSPPWRCIACSNVSWLSVCVQPPSATSARVWPLLHCYSYITGVDWYGY